MDEVEIREREEFENSEMPNFKALEERLQRTRRTEEIRGQFSETIRSDSDRQLSFRF